MAKRSKTRFANGIVSAAIVVFFLGHATLGALSLALGFTSPLAALVWVGVALVGLHVALCVATSREQLGDRERPPSLRKKRHLALKWATGGVLAALATAHVACMQLAGADAARASIAGAALTAALAAALATHLCVGAKSLLKDIGANRRYLTAFRITVCALAAAFALAACAATLR